jgi:hypothetical protein
MPVLLGDGTAGHGHGWGLRPIREGKKPSRKSVNTIYSILAEIPSFLSVFMPAYLLTSATVLATL